MAAKTTMIAAEATTTQKTAAKTTNTLAATTQEREKYYNPNNRTDLTAKEAQPRCSMPSELVSTVGTRVLTSEKSIKI